MPLISGGFDETRIINCVIEGSFDVAAIDGNTFIILDSEITGISPAINATALTMRGCDVYAYGTAIVSENPFIHDSTIGGDGTDGDPLVDLTNGAPDGCVISGCWIDLDAVSPTAAIKLDNEARLRIMNNSIRGRGGHSIQIVDCLGALISGNIFSSYGDAGIKIEGGETAMITGNKFTGSGSSGIGADYHIHITGGTDHYIVNNDLAPSVNVARLSDSGTGTVLSDQGNATEGDNRI